MLLEKLAEGVLRVQTPLGPRFVKPVFIERVYLLWVFRNFPVLPANVLSRSQQQRVERMCQRHGFVCQFGPKHAEDFALLGTLEQRLSAQETPWALGVPANICAPVSGFAADAEPQC